jgi:hypothetical protein
MKLELRHQIIAALIATAISLIVCCVVSAQSGISWRTLEGNSSFQDLVYLAVYFLAFGSPVYILARFVLAKRAGIAYFVRRKR